MLNSKKQINKMGVKKQTDKKKVVNKEMVWECLVCGHKQISNERPIKCVCTNNGNYVINNSYTVGE